MIQELTPEATVKLTKQMRAVIHQPGVKNTEKVKMLEQIVLRVTEQQKKEFKRLSRDTGIPLSEIVRTSLKTIIKHKTKHNLTPSQLVANFRSFQKSLGLIE